MTYSPEVDSAKPVISGHLVCRNSSTGLAESDFAAVGLTNRSDYLVQSTVLEVVRLCQINILAGAVV